MFLCKRKNNIFVKNDQICFCVKLKKKKKKFYQEKSNPFFMNKK